jgi:hypothetical protein
MARRRLALILAIFALATPVAGAADTSSPAVVTVSLANQVQGNTVFSYLLAERDAFGQRDTQAVPPRRISGCRYWSDWTLHRVNAVSHDRTYGVHIYDGCNHDTQVFPVPTDVRQGSCNNDDASFPSSKYSVCPIIPQGHVPAGLALDRHCEALTVADTSLLVDISPRTYDAAKPTTLTATTHFDSDMTQRLSEGTCSDVLDWQVMAWTLRWSDGSVDHLPGSGRGGMTQAHELPPAAGGTQQSDVTVIAHLHVLGQALDFDQSGNTVIRNVDGHVDISNHDGATGAGSAPVDVPPQLVAGAIAVGQAGDGTMPPPDANARPAQRAVTIRGRLLAIYPRPIVLKPGVELVNGVEVGRATSTVTGWRYTGGATDAPRGEGTPPGARGGPDAPVVLQYNHAERTDALGRPVDEAVPLELTVRTVYPDGTVFDSTVNGEVAVAIWYAGLSGTG